MTSLANNPAFPDITIEFIIAESDGRIHHTGSYHLSNDVERRAVAERIHQCLLQGYGVKSKRAAKEKTRQHVTKGTPMAPVLMRAINTQRRGAGA